MRKAIMVAVVLLFLAPLGLPQSASAQSEPFIGQIIYVGFNFCPRGFASCDGQLLPIAQYDALFSLLGTTYGGDGRTNFGLPDLRGRVPVHVGQGHGLSDYRPGERGGTETVRLTVDQLPEHNHALQVSTFNADRTFPAGGVLASKRRTTLYNNMYPDAQMHSAAIGITGESNPVPNRQPYLGIRACIAIEGVFPPGPW